jgi:hypothetical protein
MRVHLGGLKESGVGLRPTTRGGGQSMWFVLRLPDRASSKGAAVTWRQMPAPWGEGGLPGVSTSDVPSRWGSGALSKMGGSVHDRTSAPWMDLEEGASAAGHNECLSTPRSLDQVQEPAECRAEVSWEGVGVAQIAGGVRSRSAGDNSPPPVALTSEWLHALLAEGDSSVWGKEPVHFSAMAGLGGCTHLTGLIGRGSRGIAYEGARHPPCPCHLRQGHCKELGDQMHCVLLLPPFFLQLRLVASPWSTKHQPHPTSVKHRYVASLSVLH